MQCLLEIKLFGGFELKRPFGGDVAGAQNQVAGLLAMLSERIGRHQARAEIIEELWPGIDDDTGRNRFRVLLAATRRLLEPPGTESGSILYCDRSMVGLASSTCWVDTDEFQKQLNCAKVATTRDAEAMHYRAADELYAGEFLSGRSSDWIGERRMHYARLQSLGQYKFAALLEEKGDIAGAMQQISRSIDADPLREAPRRRLLRLLVESGDIGSAVEHYDVYRKLLKRSLGLVPTTELQDWVKGLKGWANGRSSVGPGAISTSDLSRNAGIRAPATRVSLPPSTSSFVGRTREVAELSELLAVQRLITLTGPGGIGKTRLATEVARANLDAFGGGVYFVPIEELPGQSTLSEVIARHVQLEPSSDPASQLRHFLSQPVPVGRSAWLFVLDGLDHFNRVAYDEVLRLLSEAPNLTILATARGVGLPGSYEYRLNPLPVPELEQRLDELMANPSVQLFFERAQAASARFSVTSANADEVAQLGRRMEGIPLAIEIAAAQARTSSIEVILQSLSDFGTLSKPRSTGAARHKSLYASLDFSFNSLTRSEQELFCGLAAFHGTFDQAAAAIVALASPAELERLAQCSLITRSSTGEANRFAMLELLREFGRSKMTAAEFQAAQERHANYFLRLITDAATLHLNSGLQPVTKIRDDAENLRAAAEWFLEKKDSESALKMAYGLQSNWIHCGTQREGRDYIQRLRNLLRLNEVQLALLNLTEGTLACFLEDPVEGKELVEKALPVLEREGMEDRVAGARWSLGFASYLAGEYEQCLGSLSKMAPTSGNYSSRLEAYQLHLLGIAHGELLHFEEAERYLKESQQKFRSLGDLLLAEYCRLSLARFKWKKGCHREACTGYAELVQVFTEWQHTRGMAFAIEGLGRAVGEMGEFKHATQLLGCAQRVRDSIGLKRDFADQFAFRESEAASKQALGGQFEQEWKSGYDISPSRAGDWVAEICSCTSQNSLWAT